MSLILSGTNGLSDVDGSAATPAIRGTDSNTGIFFPAADTIAFAEGGVEAMRIDSSGNVGIGTASPASRLDVNGNADFTTSAAAGNGVRVRSPSGSATPAIIQFTNNPVTAQWATITSPSSNVLTFNDGGGTERARIDSSGNLLVGTTSNYSAKQSIQWDSSTQGGLALRTSSATFTGSPIVFQNSSAGTSGFIGQSATTVSYNTSSDYRLKENVQPMQDALARLAALKPVTYKWKVDGSSGEGFIAHELQAVVPDCVTGEKDAVDADGNPVYQGVDTSFLVATLTAAIQEQQALITSLTARIAALEGAAQ